MSVPKFPKNHQAEVVITPAQHLAAVSGHQPDLEVPKSVILCFEGSLMDQCKAMPNATSKAFWTGEMILFGDLESCPGLVGNFGIGGPAAAHKLEALIASGVDQFVVIGHAGGLQAANAIGSILLIEKALRDEGLSHHYASAERFAYPSHQLREKLGSALRKEGHPFTEGSSWTIDSMYRETLEEVKYYQKEGIAAVEMELASLFAVATFRKVDLAAIMVISDYVGDAEWKEEIQSIGTSNGLFSVFKIAKATLSTIAHN